MPDIVSTLTIFIHYLKMYPYLLNIHNIKYLIQIQSPSSQQKLKSLWILVILAQVFVFGWTDAAACASLTLPHPGEGVLGVVLHPHHHVRHAEALLVWSWGRQGGSTLLEGRVAHLREGVLYTHTAPGPDEEGRKGGTERRENGRKRELYESGRNQELDTLKTWIWSDVKEFYSESNSSVFIL